MKNIVGPFQNLSANDTGVKILEINIQNITPTYVWLANIFVLIEQRKNGNKFDSCDLKSAVYLLRAVF
jgi:hypothetical protein